MCEIEIDLEYECSNGKKLRDFIIDFKNDYEKLESIGVGATAIVYKVMKKDTKKLYAAKVLKSFTEDDKLGFISEIKALSEFDHPALIGFRGFTNKKSNIILLDFMENGSLDRLTIKKKSTAKSLTETQKLIIAYGIASGMAELHRMRYSHRDLKPLNVLIDENFEPKISDYGISKKIEIGETCYQTAKGTPVYMAPEMFDDTVPLDFSIDVYAFSILLYELFLDLPAATSKAQILKFINGERPLFPSNTLEVYKQLIIKCWDQQPSKRPKFDEIVRILESKSFLQEISYPIEWDKYYEYIKKIKGAAVSEIVSQDKAEQNTNLTTAMERLQKSADEGDSFSQYHLGLKLKDGIGIPQDFEKAAHYFQLAAQSGYVYSMIEYALLLLQGRGVKKDVNEAKNMLKNAQMKGDIQAMYIYAMLLIEENKINEGIKLLRRSARNGFDKAQNKLGFFYEYGINIKRNEKKARKYYKKSSDQGNAKGMYSYADMLEHGKGGEVNLKECFDLIKLSAKKRYAPSICKYAEFLIEGKFVSKDIPEAKRLLIMAIEQGYSYANCVLGRIKLEGLDGSVNYEEATKLFKKASDSEDVRGMVQYGISLENGIGCEKNAVEALQLYEKAASKGSYYAMTRAGKLLLAGEDGIEEDFDKGIDYLTEAADHGNQEAKEILEEIDS